MELGRVEVGAVGIVVRFAGLTPGRLTTKDTKVHEGPGDGGSSGA